MCFKPAFLRSLSIYIWNQSLIIPKGIWDVFKKIMKSIKVSSMVNLSIYSSVLSRDEFIKAIWVSRHSLDPIRPASHSFSASSQPGFANSCITASVISTSVTVPSKSIDTKKSGSIIELHSLFRNYNCGNNL